jgi:hypothetical protein
LRNLSIGSYSDNSWIFDVMRGKNEVEVGMISLLYKNKGLNRPNRLMTK